MRRKVREGREKREGRESEGGSEGMEAYLFIVCTMHSNIGIYTARNHK